MSAREHCNHHPADCDEAACAGAMVREELAAVIVESMRQVNPLAVDANRWMVARDHADAILASDFLAKEREAAVLDYVTTKETPRFIIETTQMQQNIIESAIRTAVAAEREAVAVARLEWERTVLGRVLQDIPAEGEAPDFLYVLANAMKETRIARAGTAEVGA